MTLLKGSDYNSREINIALLSLEADIKNKITNFDTSVIDKQLAEINSRIDKINAGSNNTSAEINDIRYEIEDINSKLKGNSAKIENIEQKLSDIFSAENKVTDFNTTTDDGIYYWVTDAANKPSDYGVLLVNKYDGGSTTNLWVNQIAYGTNNKIYFRQNINSGNWTEWKAVAFEGEIKALTVNGETYDGSEAVDAGVQKIENGGTGVTTQADINKAFISNLSVGNDNVTDGTEFVSSCASDNGFADPNNLNKPYKRQFIKVWSYIKDKISSVLGLTKDNYGGTANKATNDGNGNNIVNTYALKSNLQYTKSININKIDGSSDTMYYLIAKTLSTDNFGNIDSLFVNGSDFMNRMFEGSIKTREGNRVYNYGKNNLPIELYKQTDGAIYVYWLVSDAYNRVALNITATLSITIYGGNLSNVTPTGSKMTLTEYDYKSYETFPISRGGTGATTAKGAQKSLLSDMQTETTAMDDSTEFVMKYGTPTDTKGALFKRSATLVWNYIKGKISSVLGLTASNYGGNASTATTAYSAKNMYLQTFDLTSLDKTKFYPLVCYSGNDFAEVAICSESGISSMEYNQNRIHFDISTMGWSDLSPTLNIREYTCYDNSEITIGCIGRGIHNGAWAIWLRGGLHYTCFSRNSDLSLQTTDFTYGDEVYTVGTNYYGGSNSNVNIIFTPQSTITSGAYSTRQIKASVIQAESNFIGNLTGNVTGNVTGSSGSCTGKSAQASFLTQYGTRPTSGNIVPKDSSEWGGVRKDIVSSRITDSGRPGADGHLLTMFWGGDGRWDNQLFISNDVGVPPTLKLRQKQDGTDYGDWVDVITSNNIGSQTVASAGTANTAGTADFAKRLKTFAYWNNPFVYDSTNGVRVNVYKITMPSAFNSILIQIYGDINYAVSRKYILGLWHQNNYGYNVSVTDLGGTKANGLKVWLGNDGNVYLQADVYWTSRISFSYLDDITNVTITKIGTAKYGSNKDIDGNVLFTPLTDPITDCGALRGAGDLSSASKVPQILKADEFTGNLTGNVSGTASKVANALTINGQSYDGSSALNINIYGAYDHIVHDGASLLEWANCTDGSMKKVLIKSGTYNITKSVNLTNAGTGYVFAEQGAEINSHVPIAFTASSGKTVVHNLNVVCDGASNGDNSCAFSADNPESLILYDCSATYRTYTEIVNRNLFEHCTCYNCSYAFQNLPANSSISVRVFYQCRCYNCKCSQTIEANSSTGISFYADSYFYKECHCTSCDAELTTSRNIKAATTTFACYYNCYDRCVGCLSKINVNSSALTVYSTLYGFLRCQYMSSCKETHTEGYSNIKGIVQCDFISSTSGINAASNTHVGNSCSIQ